MAMPKPASTGPNVTDHLLQVLHRAWGNPFTTRSDFARSNPEAIAEASCLGLVTTRHPQEGYGSVWRITARGLWFLEELTP